MPAVAQVGEHVLQRGRPGLHGDGTVRPSPEVSTSPTPYAAQHRRGRVPVGVVDQGHDDPVPADLRLELVGGALGDDRARRR